MKEEDLLKKKQQIIENNTLFGVVRMYQWRTIQKLNTVVFWIMIVLGIMGLVLCVVGGKEITQLVHSFYDGMVVFFTALFAVIFSVYALFQVLLQRQFVKLSHYTAALRRTSDEKVGDDSLFNIGIQFLNQIVLSIWIVIVSGILSFLTNNLIYKIVNFETLFVINSILFMLFIIVVIYYLVELQSLIFNVWRMLGTYMLYLVESDTDDDEVYNEYFQQLKHQDGRLK